MWLCTKFGFYSIVEKGRGEIHVRARCKRDLENLRRLCTGRVSGSSAWKIHRTEPADYRFRIVVGADALQEIMSALAGSLDYSNFKGVISARPDQSDKLGVYSAFHHDMERWQNRRLSPLHSD